MGWDLPTEDDYAWSRSDERAKDARAIREAESRLRSPRLWILGYVVVSLAACGNLVVNYVAFTRFGYSVGMASMCLWLLLIMMASLLSDVLRDWSRDGPRASL